MGRQDWDFLLELLLATGKLSREELSLIAALRDRPGDNATRAVYGDWLEENGRTQAAVHVRTGWAFGERNPWPSGGMSSGAIFQHHIASGTIGTYHIASGILQS